MPTTLGALRMLVRAGHVPSHAGRELGAAYRFLRRVEHRLQMTADRQVHELPQRPAEMERFVGYIKGSKRVKADEPILIPGEPELHNRAERGANGTLA